MDPSAASRRELSRLAAREPIDLARAALAIAREEYPELDEAGYLRALDEFAFRVMRGLPAGASPERRAGRRNPRPFPRPGLAPKRGADHYPSNKIFYAAGLPRVC